MTLSKAQAGRASAVAILISALVALPLAIAGAQTGSPATSAPVPPATAPAPQNPPAAQTAPAAKNPPAAQNAPAQNAPTGQSARDPEVERRIADLHKRLKITQPQEAQFNGFADTMRSNAQAMAMMAQQAQQNQNPNAVDDLRSYEQFTEAQAEGLKRLIPVFQTLYDSLNDQQKKTADALLGRAAERAQRQARPPRG